MIEIHIHVEGHDGVVLLTKLVELESTSYADRMAAKAAAADLVAHTKRLVAALATVTPAPAQ